MGVTRRRIQSVVTTEGALDVTNLVSMVEMGEYMYKLGIDAQVDIHISPHPISTRFDLIHRSCQDLRDFRQNTISMAPFKMPPFRDLCMSLGVDFSSRRSSENPPPKQKPHGFFCKLCPRSFKRKDNLDSHRLTHETNRKRPFQCDQCDRTFTRRNGLKRHKLVSQASHLDR
jgi:uncharacterized Zn-finger protein